MHKIKNVLLILLSVTTLVSLFYIVNLNSRNYVVISDYKEFDELVNNINPAQVFVDLRNQEDYEKGHIPGFINIPTESGEELLNYLDKNNLEKKHIYLMCYAGNRAAKTYNYLFENNLHNLYYIKFGYNDYVSQNQNFIPQVGECPCLAE